MIVFKMSSESTHSHPKLESISESRLLYRSVFAAFVIEGVLLTAVGWHEHWLAHPQKSTNQDESRFVEAQVFEMPPEAHLVDQKKDPPVVKKSEPTLSRRPNQGKDGNGPAPLENENQTENGPPIAQSHGPVAIFAPLPVIPHYLQDKDINTHVIIDFFVNTQGTATPHLISSSGNEELDAIALEAVHQWEFRPGEKEGKSIESKVRLRIDFEVK
jgi:TonB family protein